MWVPHFVCPECRAGLVETAFERMNCSRCGRVFELRDGVWRFLTSARRARLEPFVQQYRIVRQREGRRPEAPENGSASPRWAPIAFW